MNTNHRMPGWRAAACLILALVLVPQAQADTATPQLRQLVERLLAEHPRMAEARAALEAARARGEAADRPLYNPELELDAERAEGDTDSIGISQTIDLGNKRGARSKAAVARLAAARARIDATRIELEGRFLTALAEWQTARALDALAAERARLMARFETLAEKRFDAGDITQVDLDLARQARLRAALSRSRARGELSAAGEQLRALLPNAPSAWPALPERLPALERVDAEALLPQLPRMREAMAEVEASRGELELSRSNRIIDPTIGVRAGRENDSSLVGVTLSVPLYIRNSYRAEVQAAGAELASAEAALQRVRRERLAALNSAAERYRLIRAGWRQWQRAGAPSLSRQTATLERLWQAGELGTTEYLVQLDQTLETRAEAMRTRGELWQRWFEWLTVSAQLDQWLGRAAAPVPQQEQNP